MKVLDTNVLSELMRPKPDIRVVEWVDGQNGAELFISAITVAEILHGIARLPEGKRKLNLEHTAVDMFQQDFAERILPFGTRAAEHYANLVAASEASGRCVGMADAQIAAICKEHGAQLATRNIRVFETLGIALINPWD